MLEIQDEIKQILSEEEGTTEFEPIPEDRTGPLNQPVVEKHFGEEDQAGLERSDDDPESEKENEFYIPDEELDAPEQKIDEGESDVEEPEKPSFELPASHARQAADAILGVSDNLLEIGGGYLVKIRKHRAFFDFEEIIQVIDQQNEKNVQRIKLEPDDKILLRPLLVEVLKKRAQRLTPEQQLLGALISILFKKAQVVIEIRSENEILVERILQIIKDEHRTGEADPEPEFADKKNTNGASEKIEEAIVEAA